MGGPDWTKTEADNQKVEGEGEIVRRGDRLMDESEGEVVMGAFHGLAGG